MLRAIAVPVVAVGTLGYLTLLLTTSLTSVERVLPVGARYAFCGPYLDCHLGVTVVGASVTPGPVTRYVVRVRFDSDARRARLDLDGPTAHLHDAGGRRYRAVSGPSRMALAAGDGVISEFVFETPGPLVEPRLRLQEGVFVERVLERLLIGDPDSILHKRVYLSLPRVGS
ncbi:MAG: hypothetical protein ACRENB_15285 [Gemmatimonadales bacterium]